MCLQVIVGSGLPVARQVRLTLPPSLMEMSGEISMIFGDTATMQRGEGKLNWFCFNSNLKLWVKEAEFPSSLCFDNLCSSPSVSSDLAGTNREKRGQRRHR